jgi:TRAP-type uncharacterized transport system fused permease subunit
VHKNFKKFIKYWLPVACWLLVIFFFSSLPAITVSTIDWRDFVIKKTIHLVEYAILLALLYRAIKQNLKNDLPKTAMLALIFTVLYAISDEYHQSFVSGRTSTFRDVLIDTAGSLLSLTLIWNLLPKAPGKLKNWAKKLEII